MKLSDQVVSLLSDRGPVVVAVSGGPDSMCVMTLIRRFWVEQGRCLSDLYVAHYHHGQRGQSDDEVILVQEAWVDCSVYVGYYDGDSCTERDLRLARHGFFQSVMEAAGSSILVTGHNLTDRIETSLMNIRRGCQIKGFINMSEIEDNNIWVQGGSSIKLQQQTMLRPLLHHAKKVIEQYCDEQKISYAIDKSNADVTVSQRNQMRHEVVMKMSGQELGVWQSLYRRLEEGQKTHDCPVRNEQMQGWSAGSIGDRDLDHLAWLFDWSGCYADMTQGRLLEWQRWIRSSYQGEKFVGGRRRWIKQKTVWLAPLSD